MTKRCGHIPAMMEPCTDSIRLREKVGQALAGGVSGFALSAIGYDSLAAAQTAEVQGGIYGIATLFPGIVYILVGLVMIFLYPLSKKIVIQNTEELKRRREET